MISDLYLKLKKLNVKVKLVDDNLDLKAPKGVLTGELLAEIKRHKPALIDLINTYKQRKEDYSAIRRADNQKHYPLSSSQFRLWVLSQFEESNVAYNSPGVYVFEGQLDIASLEYALNALIARHESLRTVFREDEQGSVRQFIQGSHELPFRISCHDLRGKAEQQKQLEALMWSAASGPFNLSSGPLFRAALYQLEEHKWIFGYVIHHIVMDGWSMNIFINELLHLYNAHATGIPPSLMPLRIQYKDYVVWQQAQLGGEALQVHKDYWLKQFAGELPVLDLPGDHVRPLMKTYRAGALNRQLGAGVSNGIKDLIDEQGASLFMGLLAAVNALLYRYTRQEDMVIGTPIAGREHADLGDQIGYYGNTLALRIKYSGENSYRELLENIKQIVLSAYEHQMYPFDDLVEELHLHRDMSRNPLFDVQVIVGQDAVNITQQQLGSLTVSQYEADSLLHSRFDMVFTFGGVGEELALNILYNADIYDSSTVERMATHLEQLMAAIIEAPEKPVQELRYLSAAEREMLLVDFNDTAIPFPQEQTIVSLFEAQVVRYPAASATVFRQTSLTYQELDEKANQLAHYLRGEYGIRANDLVGIMLDRSEKTIIAILGVLKAGGAYVPIDTEYPQSRKEFIIQDTGIKVLITQTDYIFDLEYYSGPVFAIDVQLEAAGTPVTSPGIVLRPTDLAYVIYTSGSTGQPKGVMIEHGAICNTILAQQEIFDVQAGERHLQFASTAFDAAVSEIFVALVSAGTLCIVDEVSKKNPALLEQFITENRIDIATIPPAFLKLLQTEKIQTLQKLVTAGEAAMPDNVMAFSRYGTYYNAYGPTEVSICATVFRLNKGAVLTTDIVPIGRPIPNAGIYILDEHQELVPVGVMGELCISGAGLARGYRNRPDLTTEKFMPHPFKAGERLYRSGDIARWLPDGNIAFAGRRDEQVKIRGYRIEPGEIETALQSYEGIDTAVVIAKANKDGDKDLVAYLVGKATLNTSAIREHLSRLLPAYMVPAYFVKLEHLPLTSNGKLDKKSLPDPEASGMGSASAYVAPRNETEEKLVLIWNEILGREKTGIRSGFFELGGDSIKILKMLSEVRKRLDLEIPIADVYKHNTIEQLMDHVDLNKVALEQNRKGQLETEAVVIEAIAALKERILASDHVRDRENIADVYPMSDVEKGMVFESLKDTGLGIYHDQMVRRRWFADFRIERLNAALALLVEKHTILRTGFNMSDYEAPVQIVYERAAATAYYEDLAGRSLQEQEVRVRDFMKAELGRPFNVMVAPLWRIAVFDLGNNDIVFVFQCHHAIIDGWSDALFITELNNLYLQLGEDPDYKPAKLRSDYKDFIIQHEIDKKDESIKAFWQNELSDYKRLDLFTEEIAVSNFARSMGSEELTKLEQLALDLKTSIKAISFTAYLLMLKVLDNENEIVAGLVTNTRLAREDGDKVLGCFLNAVPFKMVIDDDIQCDEQIVRVQDKLIALKNYERISVLELSDIHNQHEMGNHFFDMFFNYVDFHAFGSLVESAQPVQAESAPPALDLAGHGLTNTYLDFTINRTGGIFQMGLHLTRKLRSGLTAASLGNLYFDILSSIVHAPGQVVHQLDYIGADEKEKLLVTFNSTQKSYPGDSTIVSLFEAQVKRTPDNIALVFEERELTYAQLNERSNQWGDYLRRHYHIRPNDLVAIKLERDEEMIIAMLGVLKSGGACVPIAPGYPQERVDHMMTDSDCRVLIDEAELMAFRKVRQKYRVKDLKGVNGPRDLVCVIYTSGSTGRPKGCMLENRGIINHLCSKVDLLQLSETSVICHNSQLHFVGGIWQLWAPLIVGGKCVLCNEEELKSISKLLHKVVVAGGDMVEVIPSQLNEHLFYEGKIDLTGIHTLILTGEKLNTHFVDRCYSGNDHLQIINTYGQTECSDVTTWYKIPRVSAGDNVLIGRPIQNTQIYILSNAGALCPIGVIGEICAGGDGVSKGYINKPELTAEKFIADPFSTGGRLYKTGDLGRWLPDGNIVIIGRKDAQVKVRGYRVEPGEIENALRSNEAITSTVVVARSNAGGENELIAYVVAKEALNTAALRAYLSKRLPDYMVPGYFVQLAALPLAVNGKVDRQQLPDPEGSGMESGIAYVAPRNDIEEKLVQIWQDILGREQISVKDDFFQLGGHSLKATRLSSQIHKVFDVKMSINELFSLVVLEDQAALIERSAKQFFMDIPLAPAQSSYVLSSSQRRLWVLSQFEGGNAAYNMPGAYMLEGDLDKDAFERAFDTLLERHEILRTVLKEDEQGEIKQFVQSTADAGFHIVHQDLRGEAVPKRRLQAYIQQYDVQPFDLAVGPLIRASLMQVADDQWGLSYVMHHIISDGWSMNVLMNELLMLYNGFIKGVPVELPPLRIQYKDYSVWQQGELIGGVLEEHKEYWLQQFEGRLPVLELSTDKPRPAIKTYNGGNTHRTINATISNGIKALCQEQGCTLFMGLLATVNALMYRYTLQEDLVIGSPIAGRMHADFENQIGFYSNMLALRTRFSGSDSFMALLSNNREVTLGAYAHQAYPFDELVDALDIPHDLSRHPIFDVVLVLQNTSLSKPGDDQKGLGALKLSPCEGAVALMSKFDLTIDFAETGDVIQLSLAYNTDIYSKNTAERLILHLEQLLAAVVEQPHAPINTIDYLNEAERHALLTTFDVTAVTYPTALTLVDLFEMQVAETPDNIALAFEQTALTYRELNERANLLGDYLRQQYHITAGDLVGIQLGRSEWMVIAIMGILKSGGAYVPIDPEYPQDRIEYMIADSQCKVVIDEKQLAMLKGTADRYSKENPAILSQPDDPAYVIYTSGTTGRPKGTVITHRNVVRLMKNDQPLFDFNAKDVWTLFHSYCFDFSVWEMYGALLFGGKLVIVPSITARDPQVFIELLKREGVTVLNQTPSAFYNVIKQVSETSGTDLQLRYVIFGGEALSPVKLMDWKKRYPDTKLINMYGITETTVHVTYKEITDEMIFKNISNIGRPIPTLSCYVLDQNQQLLPPGVPGELYVGGAGVAKGYLNRDDLNRQRFIANPFNAGDRLYRSGDTVKISDGWEMEYLGRIDAQVKIRGYRIELGEIENAIQQHPSVTAAVVIARSNAEGEKELVAYIAGTEPLNTPRMREWLGKFLPDHMLPGYFVQLEALPLTSNGKVDKKRLPDPESLGMQTDVVYVAPRNNTEEKLVLMWQEILRKEKIGVNDNFYELGGHSLLMIRLLNKVNKGFDNANIRLIDLMQQPAIALLGALIDGADGKERSNPSILRLRDGDDPVATFIIPGMPGISDGYLDMARKIPTPGPVYGLQMKGLIAGEAPLDSIEAMAAHNIGLIRTIMPSGSIRLYAHSYGGTVVYEMLRQLKDTDIAVTAVVLIESVPMGQGIGTDKAEIGLFLDNFFDVNGLTAEKQNFNHLWDLCERSLSVKYHYADKLPYTVIQIIADGQGPRENPPGGTCWQDHYQQVNVVHAAGDHFSIVKEPYCSGWLANIIH